MDEKDLGTSSNNTNDASRRRWPFMTVEQLEAQWSAYLDWADANDDDGGHVGFSRYYREQAAAIAKELQARKEAEMLTKHETVLNRSLEPSYEVGVRFNGEADEDGNPARTSLLLDPDCWREMGEPDTLTLVVESGDKLNV